jgi:hypothetical protein
MSASNFPKLPGYVPTHDPTNVDHKKISHIKLEKLRNAKVVPVPLYALPKTVQKNFLPEKTEFDKSLSHVQYPNHNNTEINELFEPTFVKLDKQLCINFYLIPNFQIFSNVIDARYNILFILFTNLN